MFVIVTELGGKRTWKVFPTEEQRNAEFSRLKDVASHSGCGGQCTCFQEYWKQNGFIHCGGWRTEIVPNLRLLDEKSAVTV